MTSYNFSDFLKNIIVENLHPELKEIVSSSQRTPSGYPTIKSKQAKIAAKIRELSKRGEPTGIEGNMPKGSSRAYLPHAEKEHIILDGKPAKIKTGTKVAIKATLDKFHEGDRNLGNMQNEAEGGDYLVNRVHRILTKNEDGSYTSNKESGIFPPLIEHDHEKHEWSHVGHVGNITKAQFKSLTKTKTHPNGISHADFVDALTRQHRRNSGKYWENTPKKENHLDRVDEHPLVQKFSDYHNNWGASPADYGQIKNLGIFEHPDGSKHIVARDHGFNTEVEHAYRNARVRQAAVRH